MEKQIIDRIKELNNFTIDNYNKEYLLKVLQLFYLNQKYLNNSNTKINIYLEELLENIFTHPSILIKLNEDIDEVIANIISKRIILQEN